ncbi:MAG: hypothetical protein OEX19_03640 [Gammaproteobacteria bacterium]|nr:hypothetical protein [Gammaproteobacteria bacterium]
MHMKTYIQALLISTLLLFVSQTHAGGLVDISRDYGPFNLGMSNMQFTKITGIEATNCPICVSGETFVALDMQQARKHIPEDENVNGVDFFFLNEHLYLISRTPDSPSLFKVREEISASFGNPDSRKVASNGVSILAWRDEDTIISVNYDDINEEVFSVETKDSTLSKKRDILEAILIEETVKITP